MSIELLLVLSLLGWTLTSWCFLYHISESKKHFDEIAAMCDELLDDKAMEYKKRYPE